MGSLYFDNAATTRPSQLSIDAYNKALEVYENPSSSHSGGDRAKKLLENARKEAAIALGLNEGDSRQIFFTSSATECNSIVLQSVIRNYKSGRVIISNAEHPSVKNNKFILERCGFEVIALTSKNGKVECADLQKALTPDTVLVSIIYVSNLIGTKNDICTLAKTVKDYSRQSGKDITFHTDCVQAIGKTEFSLLELHNSGVDAASFSGHKFYSPRGTGILYSSKQNIRSLSEGGGQESGVRGGTENLASIVATVEALKEEQKFIKNHIKTIQLLKTTFLNEISAFPFVKLLTPSSYTEVVPSIVSLSLNGLPGEITVRALSSMGILVGTTSACSANTKKNERNALSLLGFDSKTAEGAIRISFSKENTADDVITLAKAIEKVYNTYR